MRTSPGLAYPWGASGFRCRGGRPVDDFEGIELGVSAAIRAACGEVGLVADEYRAGAMASLFHRWKRGPCAVGESEGFDFIMSGRLPAAFAAENDHLAITGGRHAAGSWCGNCGWHGNPFSSGEVEGASTSGMVRLKTCSISA